jgi:hypothetical protein
MIRRVDAAVNETDPRAARRRVTPFLAMLRASREGA